MMFYNIHAHKILHYNNIILMVFHVTRRGI